MYPSNINMQTSIIHFLTGWNDIGEILLHNVVVVLPSYSIKLST